jgi:hypothetical protein
VGIKMKAKELIEILQKHPEWEVMIETVNSQEQELRANVSFCEEIHYRRVNITTNVNIYIEYFCIS